MAAKSRCIIIGASHAAAQLAPTLRQQGWTGSISMISDEYSLPYHRPPSIQRLSWPVRTK